MLLHILPPLLFSHEGTLYKCFNFLASSRIHLNCNNQSWLTFQSSACLLPFASLSPICQMFTQSHSEWEEDNTALKLTSLFFPPSHRTICSHWGSEESENTDWVKGKLALPLLASAFAYVDLRVLWDYRISITPMRLKPSWNLEQKTGAHKVSHWFPSSSNSVWAE